MLSHEELQRYARHIVLRDIGGPGQQALKAARVVVVGAGGLGSPILQYLAAAGVGTIGIVDDDTVSLSNLQRQVIHGTPDIGRPKVASARDAILRLNPHVTVEAHAIRLDATNARNVLSGYDVVIDGTDNFATRFLVADACEALERPLVAAAVIEFYGWVTVLMPYATGPDGSRNPSLRAIMRQPDDGRAQTCAEFGILGVVPGILGTLAAAEALKLVLGLGMPLVRRMLTVDVRDMSIDALDYEGEPATGTELT
ncbi:MAG: molybdopterin-synthase adenylyltransferase MoeB [Ancalomicrobiaceae bacterium]|nr:molybdopterin-synthase adenylyltransferase MoeB [Ancalomicrobiaceae bacterium]